MYIIGTHASPYTHSLLPHTYALYTQPLYTNNLYIHTTLHPTGKSTTAAQQAKQAQKKHLFPKHLLQLYCVKHTLPNPRFEKLTPGGHGEGIRYAVLVEQLRGQHAKGGVGGMEVVVVVVDMGYTKGVGIGGREPMQQ